MKTCFKCGESKPITEFYRHAMMSDGHLGKCKDWTRKDTNDRYLRRMEEPEWRENELLRQRIKTRNSVHRITPRTRKKQPKRPAVTAVGNAIRDGRLLRKPCQICGSKAQAHHEDYSNPFEVMWLCHRHHADRHIELRQLQEYGKVINL